MDKVVVLGASLIIMSHGKFTVIDSYRNPVEPFKHYEVWKRPNDGKVVINPTDKPLTKWLKPHNFRMPNNS